MMPSIEHFIQNESTVSCNFWEKVVAPTVESGDVQGEVIAYACWH